MNNIIIGNIISAAAACFLAASCITYDTKKVYSRQLCESLLLIISSIFFGASTRLVTQLLAVIRCGLVLKGHYNKTCVWVFVVMNSLLGVAVNTTGIIGLIPVIASVQLTICNYSCKSIDAIKLSLLVNTLLWTVYSACISDYAYVIANVLIIAAGLISYSRSRSVSYQH